MTDDPWGGVTEPPPASPPTPDRGVAIGDETVRLTLYRRVDYPELPPSPMLEAPAQPVSGHERIAALDLLRGVAVLGILIMNIVAFALPLGAYAVPTVMGAAEGLDLVTWYVNHVLVEGKFLAIFSMLFGAGVGLMYDRTRARGGRFGRVHYRRMGVLLLIGSLHGYLLWWGDVLWSYALIGLLLYFFRGRAPRTLLTWSVFLLLLGGALQLGHGTLLERARVAHGELAQATSRGDAVDPGTEQMAMFWGKSQETYDPDPETLARTVAIHRGSYGEILRERAPLVTQMQFAVTPMFLLPRLLGIMLLGLFLFRVDVLTGARSTSFYRRLAIIGYVGGLPPSIVSAHSRIASDFDHVQKLLVDAPLAYLGSILMALGHVAVIILIQRSGGLGALRARLRAVGRMALSNYLAQTVLATGVFYGYGFGLFGHLSRFELMGVVVIMWFLQLLWSPWWMARFRFGPVEWVWRALTYGRRPPFRAARSGGDAAPATVVE
jgi:uncharacterized protein